MATNIKSTIITNADASPVTLNLAAAAGGTLMGSAATLEASVGEVVGTIYRFFRLPSNAVLHSLHFACDDIGSAASTLDLGLYPPGSDTAADDDILATLINIAGGAVARTDVLHEVNDINKAGKRLWELLGLSSDPKVQYDVCGTLEGATIATAGGTLSLWATWAAG